MRLIRLAAWIAAILPVVAAAQAAPTPAASCLVITMDTLRADRLGCYGSTRGLTPSLDAFARRAALFEHAETAVPQTLPSHTTLFSGWNPDHHGVRKNLEVRVPGEVPLLAEAFRARGAATAAFVSSVILLPQYGLGRGFSTYEARMGKGTEGAGRIERAAQDTLALALPWIQRQQGQWFCWVHLFDPHTPYEPPEPFSTKYSEEPYDGEVAYLDSELGKFLGILEREGRLQKTLVILCGDHGEGLGEHEEETHGVFLYETTTRVPLLLRLPGQTAGSRIAQDVGLVDVASTVRELCTLPQAPGDGTSLLPLLSGHPIERGPVYIESLEALYSYGWSPLYAAVDAHHKFILAPRAELYDLDGDPREERNLFAEKRGKAAALRSFLEQQLRPPGGITGTPIRPDEEELRALQSLGYISGTPGQAGATYKDPKDGASLLKDLHRGMLFYDGGQYREAAEVLEKVAAKDPSNPNLFFALGECYSKFSAQQAFQSYKRALQLRPLFPQALAKFTFLLINAGKFEDAYRVASLALQDQDLVDTNGEIHLYCAYAAYYVGRPEAEILNALDEAARVGAVVDLHYRLRALVALRRNDRPGALAQLKSMAKVTSPESMARLAADPAFKPLWEDPVFQRMMGDARKRIPNGGK